MSFCDQGPELFQQVRLIRDGESYSCWIPDSIAKRSKRVQIKSKGEAWWTIVERIGKPREEPLYGDIKAAGRGKYRPIRFHHHEWQE